ncbi:alpha-galactosidase-like protein [Haloactinopolyspora alba]|uniref:Alpha-galactosidase-like protein n=1 Tax=Haloactinopolyspora alba TaxID=648780 RepID=A0A2P8E5F2_9ACTN|nr:discoidin domain-containing protein [Haloactinopolyspora alba]PSL04691.1 alpha-galactosidase-like protein [Haloactinopolyspora alba]
MTLENRRGRHAVGTVRGRGVLAVTGVLAMTALTATATPVAERAAAQPHGSDAAQPAPRTGTGPYPEVGAGTSVLDHGALLGDVVEPAWYEANVPFVDLPDEQIEDTYYYRWRVVKEALKYTGPEDGWIVSEFLGPVGYSAPNGGIVAAAAHHIREGRWLRDHRYLDDYVDYWLRGSGSGPKPATDFLNENTTDWAHQYSFWAADAVLARARVDGRLDHAIDRLPELEKQWKGWSGQFDDEVGLYWQTPVWDAMEYTASSYQSDDPYHGGAGFRPTLNSYQYGDARAIAHLLRLRGDEGDAAAAERYEQRARQLKRNQERWLWDPADEFYKHVMRDDNPDRSRLADREQIGFIPWYFHMAPPENAAAWSQLTDPQGFAAPYGPTTVERRSPWFMHEASDGCCRWNGPSWPYSTSQTLTALANLLIDYPDQPHVDRADYYDSLRKYALTQRKDGEPYVAEAHHPDEDRWLYDSAGHSEDYNHSTFNDLVLSGLLGVRPRTGDSVEIAPLAPRDWDHFALENLAYHGRNLTVLWDRDGSAYRKGAGLSVWLDGEPVHRQDDLSPVTVDVPSGTDEPLPEVVDDLANVDGTGYPSASATYTFGTDSAANAIDGQDLHIDTPSSRWTNYASPNDEDRLTLDLGVPTPVSDIRLSFYDDGGGVRTPDAYRLEYRTDAGDWRDLPDGRRSPASPRRGVLNRVLLDEPVLTDGLRLTATREDGGAVGVSAWQAWRAEDPRLTVGVDTGAEDVLAVRAGETAEVATTVTVDDGARAVVVRPKLLVPRGWEVSSLGRTRPTPVRAGETLRTRWEVTPPDDLALGSTAPLRAMAKSRLPGGARRSTGAVAETESVFDPADFPETAWVDDFTDDRVARYRVDRPFGEAAAELTVADGALTATSEGRSGFVLAAPVDASPHGTAVIVEPRSFAGTSPEDSIFAGLSGGDGDSVLAWYNNHHGTSAVDIRAGGSSHGPPANGGCCADVTWEPGDRFAAVIQDGSLTSWIEHDGRWRRIHTAPFSVAVDRDVVHGWSPAMGLRLETGELSLERFTVRTR